MQVTLQKLQDRSAVLILNTSYLSTWHTVTEDHVRLKNKMSGPLVSNRGKVLLPLAPAVKHLTIDSG